MTLWTWIGILVAVGLVLSIWYAYSSPLRISAEEAKQKLKTHDIDKVVDVRTDLEVKTLGSYPGSIHIPSAELPVRAASQLGKQDRILLYCNTGQRARAAAETLQGLGYPNVRYIVGSYTSLM